MQLGYLILCDAAEVVNGKLYALGGGWNTLTLPLPTPWTFGIALALDVPWHLTNQRHKIEIEVVEPDGEVLGSRVEVEFEQGRPPGALEGQDQRISLALPYQAELTTTGPHAVIVRYGDQEIGRSRFYVIDRSKIEAGL